AESLQVGGHAVQTVWPSTFLCPKTLSVSAVVLMRVRRGRIDHRCESHIPADSMRACYMIALGVWCLKRLWADSPSGRPPKTWVEEAYFFGAGITDTFASASTSSCRRIWIG